MAKGKAVKEKTWEDLTNTEKIDRLATAFNQLNQSITLSLSRASISQLLIMSMSLLSVAPVQE